MPSYYSSPERAQASQDWKYVEPNSPQFKKFVWQVIDPIAHILTQEERAAAEEALFSRQGLANLLDVLDDPKEKRIVESRFNLVPGLSDQIEAPVVRDLVIAEPKAVPSIDVAMNKLRDAIMASHIEIDVENIRQVPLSRLINSGRAKKLIAELQVGYAVPRLAKSLRRYRVNTVGDLMDKTEEELMDLTMSGYTAVDLAKALLKEFDLELKSEVNENEKLSESEFLEMVRNRQLETAKRKLGRRAIDHSA